MNEALSHGFVLAGVSTASHKSGTEKPQCYTVVTVYIKSKELGTMDGSTIFQAPQKRHIFFDLVIWFSYKQEVCFLLYFLGQIVS